MASLSHLLHFWLFVIYIHFGFLVWLNQCSTYRSLCFLKFIHFVYLIWLNQCSPYCSLTVFLNMHALCLFSLISWDSTYCGLTVYLFIICILLVYFNVQISFSGACVLGCLFEYSLHSCIWWVIQFTFYHILLLFFSQYRQGTSTVTQCTRKWLSSKLSESIYRQGSNQEKVVEG